ncbi:hypothetical protein PR048_021501 [Dryococelus australis]|uniref:Uncharacterized protein n=1 Tax=Dryococelus australis TaxID=614101 RepID=A0ABQ9GYF3_9NEOP|nr:hypothetical protein PR048_021501 [Dryococelus australis]
MKRTEISSQAIDEDLIVFQGRHFCNSIINAYGHVGIRIIFISSRFKVNVPKTHLTCKWVHFSLFKKLSCQL